MIPILFDENTINFDTFGIGVLKDILSCEVTEERNGEYECVFKYPVNSFMFGEIQNGRIIKIKASEKPNQQLFRVYRISTVIDGVITVYAQHISYDLLGIATPPIRTAPMSPALALSQILDKSATSHNFTSYTDLTESTNFGIETPKSIRSALGGDESILSNYGGEFEWDNFTIKLHSERGIDTGVTIEYGKNLTDMEVNVDSTSVYTDIFPYAIYEDEVVILEEQVLPLPVTSSSIQKTLVVDLTSLFDDEDVITEELLRVKANEYLIQSPLGLSNKSIKISFEPLHQQKEYSALFERVSLCDTVTVRHTDFGVDVKSKVIKTQYDTLNEKYISITLGEAKQSLLDDVNSTKDTINKVDKEVKKLPTIIKSAVEKSSSLITGQSGGYVVLNGDENGYPYEILIMDEPSIDDAVNVWRWNNGGLGFSRNGYNGPYEIAITSDGEIVANFITSGTLLANIIKAGVISSVDGSSYWDLDTGEVQLFAYAKNVRIDEIDESITEIKINAEGLSSYVSSVTSLMEETEEKANALEVENNKIKEDLSLLSQTVDGLKFNVTEKFIGGINYVQNSAGLNGITDDWIYSGTVRTDTSTDTQNNTISNSAFVLSSYSTLKQTITGVMTGSSYVISVRAKKDYESYTAYFKVTYNGNQSVYLFNTQDSFAWSDFNIALDYVSDSTIIVEMYSRADILLVSDILITGGNTIQKWSPATNEIYTSEVKIDKRGIEVANNSSSQKTVITNTEFSGYYNDEVIFTLNKDETRTKKTSVDGDLTVGKVKFIPKNTGGNGLNIVVLD